MNISFANFDFFLNYSVQGAILSIFCNEFVNFFVKIHFKRFKAAPEERSPLEVRNMERDPLSDSAIQSEINYIRSSLVLQ